MKNQETIMNIKCDIATLKNKIEVSKAWYEANNYPLDTLCIKRMSKSITALKKTLRKLEKEDRKTWREALIIAHGGIRAWWLEYGQIVQYFAVGFILTALVVFTIYRIIQGAR